MPYRMAATRSIFLCSHPVTLSAILHDREILPITVHADSVHSTYDFPILTFHMFLPKLRYFLIRSFRIEFTRNSYHRELQLNIF